MSVDDRLPPTTAWAIVLAAVLGTGVLAIYRPATALGAGCGLAVAATAGWFGDSHRRVTLAAAFVPGIVLFGVGSVAVVADLVGVGLALVGVAVGIAIGLLVANPTDRGVERTGSATLSAAIVAGGVALVALGIDALGGVGQATSTLLWLPGDGLLGLVVALVAASAAVAGSVVLVPPAMVSAPERRFSYVRGRNALAWWVAIATAVAIAALAVLAVLTRLLPPLAFLETWLTGSALVRGLLTALTVGGLVVVLGSGVVHLSWSQTTGRENAVVPVLVGSGCGVVLSAVIVVGASDLSTGLVGTLFGVTAVVLGIGGFLVWIYAEELRSAQSFETPLLVAVSLATGSVVVGVTVDVDAGVLESARAGLVTFVALAAALFAFDIGRYGQVLGREVGRGSAARRPQLVRIGWSGAVAVLAVPVASLGALVATVVTPTLSVPSTAGVVVGLCAVVVNAWLLSRD